MKQAIILLLSSIGSLFHVSYAATPAVPPILVGESVNGPYARLFIIEVAPSSTGNISVVAKAEHKGEIAGLELQLAPTWNKMPTPEVIYEGVARIVARGDESKALVRALADAFKVKAPKLTAPTDFELKAYLKGSPRKLSTEGMWLELIRGTNPSDEYFEAYIYLDIKERFVQFQIRNEWKSDKKYLRRFLLLLAEGRGKDVTAR